MAKVVPVFKSGNKNLLFNYRPISILTCFSKIMEKLLSSRLLKFFKKHSIINHNQYGFQQQLSIVHAVLDLVNNCCDSMNEGNYA